MAVELWSAPCAELEGGWSGPVILSRDLRFRRPRDLEPRVSQAGAAVVEIWQRLKTSCGTWVIPFCTADDVLEVCGSDWEQNDFGTVEVLYLCPCFVRV